ncbi:MAG: TonB-dependent receptor [Gammaproteobacteria bacterium]|nr:TonB-dependent receptor [Gammaproteobacteria bacterium]
MQASGKYSITPVTAAVAAALYPGHSAVAQDETMDNQVVLDEIIVTSRKRSESVQEIPATIQAISQESLAAMGAKTMEDYSRFVPSVNVVTYGGSGSTVVFRGAITGPDYIGQATSSVYLDEISVTQTGTQPTLRAVDIARVEALSGPQGTLYGSDAQAGTMRILTNKPVMNMTETIFDGEVRGGGESDMSFRGSLVFNTPLIEDKLALRVVGFNDRDGGFIDNVFGHTPDWHGPGDRSDPANNRAPANGGTVLWGTLDNAHAVDENWNDNDVYGGRVHLLWEMNDSWSATLSYHNQRSEQGGDNAFDPFVGDLQVIRFHDDYAYESFNMGSLVVEGDLGFAQLLASVSYFEREATGMSDCTVYCHYWAAAYCHDSYYTAAYAPYYWANPDTGYVVWWPVYCQGPTVDSDFYTSYPYESNDDKLTAELRLSSQGDTFDWIVGAYYEESKDSWKAPFATPTNGGRAGTGADNIWQQSISAQFWEFYFGTPHPNATSHWSSGSHTDWEQFAVFGEATWHINDDIALTVGGRYFDRSNENFYFVNHPGGTEFNEGQPDILIPETRAFRLANDLRPFGRKGDEQKFIPKVSLSYGFDDNKLIYGLYTQGVRQGGINRARGEPFFPTSYDSDLMNNYEVGYKSTFANGRGRFNVTAYYMLWEDYQLSIVDPSSTVCPSGDPNEAIAGQCGQPWQQVIANLGEAHIQGVVTELDYQLSDKWLFGMNFEEIEAQTDTAHDLNGDNIVNVGDGDLDKGLRLPLVPDYKASAWLEYRQPADLFGGEEFFVRTQWSFSGDSVNLLEPLPQDHPNRQFTSQGYTIGDLRLGFAGEDWQFDVFVNNITDERALYTINTGQYEWGAAQLAEGRMHHQSVFTNRPREVGVRYMKRWGE